MRRPAFLSDADLRLQIITGLKRLETEIDFMSAQQANLAGLRDMEVLRLAAEMNRVLISHDRRTMPAAFYDFILGRKSPGLILIAQGCPIRQAIEGIRICYHLLTTEEFEIVFSTFRFEGCLRPHT